MKIRGFTLRELLVLVCIIFVLTVIAIPVFASAPQLSGKDAQPAAIVLGQAASVPASFAKFDYMIKDIGLLDSGQTYVLGTSAPDGSGASVAVLGKTIDSAYVETKTAPYIAATDVLLLTGKTFIETCSSRTDIDSDRSAYAAEPYNSYMIASTGTDLALL